MTSIGKFSHASESLSNPSVPALFLAMTGPKPFQAADFIKIWKSKDISNKHPRFEQRLDSTNDGYFAPAKKSLEERVTDTTLPKALYRKELAVSISELLSNPLDIYRSLWEAKVAFGDLGASGAISQFKVKQISDKFESIVMFRSHHAMADGTSLASGLLDLCDEAEELKEEIKTQLKKHVGKTKTLLEKIRKWLQQIIWLCIGIVNSIFYQIFLWGSMPKNPFEVALTLSGSDDHSSIARTISWCDAAPVAEIKKVAKALGQDITINDVVVSCVSYAISKQLEAHRLRLEASGKVLPLFKHINVVVPVHLTGGVLLPNKPMGNMIGAFCARVPGEGAKKRLEEVHETFSWLKRSPSALLAYLLARTSTAVLPLSWNKFMIQKGSCNACAAISNVKSSPRKLHIGEGSQTIQSVAGFLPLPPGVPVGVTVCSYAGTLTLTVAAQPWAVPDADQFLLWVLEEYQRLLKSSGVLQTSKN